MSTSSSASWPAASIAAPHLGDAARDAGRGLVVDDHDGADRRGAVGREALAHDRSGSTPWRQSPGTNSTSRPRRSASVAPQRREVAGLEREHAVARRERVDERGLPRAGAGRRVDDDRPATCGRRAAGPRADRRRGRRTPGRGGRSSGRRARAGRGRGRSSGRGSAGSGDRGVRTWGAKFRSRLQWEATWPGMRDPRRTPGRASLLALLVVVLCSSALYACGSGPASGQPGVLTLALAEDPDPLDPTTSGDVREPDRLRRHVREALRRRAEAPDRPAARDRPADGLQGPQDAHDPAEAGRPVQRRHAVRRAGRQDDVRALPHATRSRAAPAISRP